MTRIARTIMAMIMMIEIHQIVVKCRRQELKLSALRRNSQYQLYGIDKKVKQDKLAGLYRHLNGAGDLDLINYDY